MKTLITTGICGFVGSTLARWTRRAAPDTEVFSIDNLMRLGANRIAGSLISGSEFTMEIYEMRVT
jgi:nucleoside-diphosphate-sugar epimerase